MLFQKRVMCTQFDISNVIIAFHENYVHTATPVYSIHYVILTIYYTNIVERVQWHVLNLPGNFIQIFNKCQRCS
jgi:hypothetical protein